MERESRSVHDNIRRRVQGKMEAGLLFWLILLQKNRGGSLLRLDVLVSIKLYKGLMLKVDDA
jgi:hypothetical protein